MSLLKIEKGAEKWFAILIILLSAMLILTSFGKTEWLVYISAGFSIILGIFLYREGGVRDYIRSKGYKKISGQDFLVWASFIFGTFLVINGALLIPMVGSAFPEWFKSFMSTNGIFGGIISGSLGIIYLFIPKPK